MAALAFGAGTALQPCFAWSLLVLLGVGGLLRSYIRSIAPASTAPPWRKRPRICAPFFSIPARLGGRRPAGAVARRRPGFGAVVRGLPSLSLSLLLKDQGGTLAFLTPVTALAIVAASAALAGSRAGCRPAADAAMRHCHPCRASQPPHARRSAGLALR